MRLSSSSSVPLLSGLSWATIARLPSRIYLRALATTGDTSLPVSCSTVWTMKLMTARCASAQLTTSGC